ncbi:phosphoethanolamine transferase [Acidovorax sp. GBBC 3334]|uniref:phosphoethanolamine transferase n=1 Tax=Acidovorax sp. GBBC 3334 TaxID=2940496 RepID=UPI0023031DBF|nr:phosphoethanolamine transferase [Acidovorax sp. GBBC 3334]MDA8456516.1 phosphoethanolamine transferase [Acidovorax sp. GBBC 3334]
MALCSRSPSSTPWLRALLRGGWLPLVLACLVALGLIVLGHDGKRVAQLAVLAAPPFAWLFWPVRSRWVHRLRAVLLWAWAMVFVLDGVARAYLLQTYQAAPDSAMVLGAAANTNARESAEFLRMYWRGALLAAGFVGAVAAVLAVCVLRGRRGGPPQRAAGVADPAAPVPRSRRAALLGLGGAVMLTGAAAYASKPWRRLHPLAYWAQWNDKVEHVRTGWAHQQEARQALLERARADAPAMAEDGPALVVLVISDSVNRDNMSLYGYGRPTTPRLQAQQAALGEAFTAFEAWSADATTLPALRSFFRFGEPDEAHPHHAIAVARAAGYKVWWMSNHDDVGIEQLHGRLADEFEMNNRTPGRSGASLDSEVLDCVEEALADPAPRKLLVLHLLGAHPHYDLRFPPGANPFDDHPDAVDATLARAGRPGWLRDRREEYDAAVLYHDGIVSTLLQRTREGGAPGGYRAFMYLSDHGQEVGHGANWAGHSPGTAAGYRIPAIVWHNGRAPLAPLGLAQRPLRADWAAHTLVNLLRIEWKGYRPDRDVLDARYRWLPPSVAALAEAPRAQPLPQSPSPSPH